MERVHGQPKLKAPSPFVQVCDRCRWKKIKCDGNRPCNNCRRANLPCETRARLSKNSAPRSYVQYLEERIRQLEGDRESTWSPQASDSRNSPYGEARLRDSISHSSADHPKKKSLPDWTVLKELGTHVIDEDGFTRYMGPSSGVGFSAKVLQEILDDNQPADQEYYSLFSIDDFSRSRALESADYMLWELVPTNLPRREDAEKVLNDYFTFTERVFPVLHRPTFMKVVDDLYNLPTIGPEWFEQLAQFYFALSIGHCYNRQATFDERTNNQIRGLQTGARCFITTLHTRRDGLTRLQTFILHAYALVLLRQRSEAMRMSAMANTKALECGLHHDGWHYSGNPLETEMRRRVFCFFTDLWKDLFNSSLEGLPRALHEADITVAEPSDVDDEQLTTTAILNAVPGRTKMHRFISVCRLVRILSRSLDVLYSHNRRKHASIRIEQMNRLCCEHLLDQLDFSFEETPDDMPDHDTDDPEKLAILAAHLNEQCLYHYIRWLIHRPGIALPRSDPQFASSLQIASDAAAAMLKALNEHKHVMRFILANPAAHPCTAFIAALTPLYRSTVIRSMPGSVPLLGYSADVDRAACDDTLSALGANIHGHSDEIRHRVLTDLVEKVFGKDQHGKLKVEDAQTKIDPEDSTMGYSSEAQSSSLADFGLPEHDLHFQEEQLQHFTAHQDLNNLVQDAFSSGMGTWAPDPDFHFPGDFQ